MNIVIVGYGKMGEQVEKVVRERKHNIAAFVDNEKDWKKYAKDIKTADVAIDFSTPKTVLGNIENCFEINLPIVVGTTGWYAHLKEVKEKCLSQKKSMLYASNFSIGVNLFFALNRQLALLMNKYDEYNVSIEETHHLTKQDAPSGTAITLANDIVGNLVRKESWINEVNTPNTAAVESQEAVETIPKTQTTIPWKELIIKSERSGNNIGTHTVTYESAFDLIEIRHSAINRKCFAIGAVVAAEWIADKIGFFTINDFLSI